MPPGNPVTPGTVIEDTWANPTMDDIAQALEDSLSRLGQGGMLAPFKFADGSVSAPASSWANEPTSGAFRESTNTFWFVVGGDKVFGLTKDGIQLGTGKAALNIASLVIVQDAEPVSIKNGTEWFKSDKGGLYMRYQNPDLTFTWVLVNSVGGDFVPMRGLNALLGDFATDAAAASGGVALGALYRTGNAVKVRIA